MKKNRLLYEVFKQSQQQDFDRFLKEISDENGVINAEILFQYKKDYDKMLDEALKRVNSLGKPVKD